MHRPRPRTTVAVAGAAFFALVALAAAAAPSPSTLALVGRYDGGGSEIAAYDRQSERVFVTDAAGRRVDILSIADPSQPTLVGSIDVSPGSPNSVAVDRGVVAVAVEAPEKTDAGSIRFYDADGRSLHPGVRAGALPDMLVFTHDHQFLLVANEGEPSGYGAGVLGSGRLGQRDRHEGRRPEPVAGGRAHRGVRRTGDPGGRPHLRPGRNPGTGSRAGVRHRRPQLEDRVGDAAGEQRHRPARRGGGDGSPRSGRSASRTTARRRTRSTRATATAPATTGASRSSTGPSSGCTSRTGSARTPSRETRTS